MRVSYKALRDRRIVVISAREIIISRAFASV